MLFPKLRKRHLLTLALTIPAFACPELRGRAGRVRPPEVPRRLRADREDPLPGRDRQRAARARGAACAGTGSRRHRFVKTANVTPCST